MKKNYLLFEHWRPPFSWAGCIVFQNRSHEEREEKKTLRVGVTLYREMVGSQQSLRKDGGEGEEL